MASFYQFIQILLILSSICHFSHQQSCIESCDKQTGATDDDGCRGASGANIEGKNGKPDPVFVSCKESQAGGTKVCVVGTTKDAPFQARVPAYAKYCISDTFGDDSTCKTNCNNWMATANKMFESNKEAGTPKKVDKVLPSICYLKFKGQDKYKFVCSCHGIFEYNK